MVIVYALMHDGTLKPMGRNYENTDQFVKAERDNAGDETFALIPPFSIVSFEDKVTTKVNRSTYKGEE